MFANLVFKNSPWHKLVPPLPPSPKYHNRPIPIYLNSCLAVRLAGIKQKKSSWGSVMNDTFFFPLEQIHKGIYFCLSVMLRYLMVYKPSSPPPPCVWLQTWNSFLYRTDQFSITDTLFWAKNLWFLYPIADYTAL